jgi:glycosyltransferase involved in cell wall biosynthesis
MIKICHVTTVHRRYDIRIFEKECKSLAIHFDVFLMVTDGLGNERKEGVQIIDCGAVSKNRLLRIISSSWKMYRVTRAMKECLVFHFHDPELLLMGLCLSIFHNKKVIYDVHEDVPEDILVKYWIPKPVRTLVSWCYKQVESAISRKLSLIVCSTPYIRQRLIRTNTNTIDIKNYPQPMFTEINSVERTYALCYIGLITASRGIIHILNILDKVNCRFALAGTFESDRLENQLRAHANWRLVDYQGVVSQKEVRDLLVASEIGIVVLADIPTFVQSLPLKLFEYMGAGLAVIASNFPLWKEIVEENECGLCIPPTEAKLLEAVNYLLANKSLVRQMGTRGIEAVRNHYNWHVEFVKLLQAYNDLVQNR